MPTVNPVQADILWRKALDRELDIWAHGLVGEQTPAELSGARPSAEPFRLPREGEPVSIFGVRKRPELNGARGEVLSGGMDASGRVSVRVFDSSVDLANGKSKRMNIQASCLIPLRHAASSPTLLGGDEGCSVATCSRQGSYASRARSGASRRTPSVFSSTAMSTLSRAASQPR
eukprot:TRINITY_DN1739_c8_g1_i1.p1 TRINITY_DN1739_c8_g1~~TRINITY_DN1739_c8_g1_i1.p1  ORF type:complete len:174 (+),score=27.30 TRINITY_DN1739_c8_g1_i1:156-677(+)